jgi:hypothetical protein
MYLTGDNPLGINTNTSIFNNTAPKAPNVLLWDKIAVCVWSICLTKVGAMLLFKSLAFLPTTGMAEAAATSGLTIDNRILIQQAAWVIC